MVTSRLWAIINFLSGRITFNTLIQVWLPSSLRNCTELDLQIILCNQYHVELITPNGVIVDAGANEGVFSAYVASLYPQAMVYAFEPSPAAFKKLQENTSKYPNVKCFNFALGAENGTTTISDMGNGNDQLGNGETPIEIKTIDSLTIPMTFLKMDVEGYEENILQGAKETIVKYHPVVAMSAYHKKSDPVRLPEVLNSFASYACKLFHDREMDLICQ